MSHILVVDDSSTVRNEVSGFLSQHGFEVAVAADGRAGLDCLRAQPGIRLVICDVNMPVMDGITMAEKVRGELNNSAVPIIMLTTENDPKLKERGKAAGVRGWIVKPFNGNAVIGAIRKLVA